MRTAGMIGIVIGISVALAGCGGNKGAPAPSDKPSAAVSASGSPTPSTGGAGDGSVKSSPKASSPAKSPPSASGTGSSDGLDPAALDPNNIAVLVNKQYGLPDTYDPTDLVYPNVPFTFKEQIEKRKMRKEAASALEQLFAGAKKDGIYLAGVSAYRSYATQKAVFNNYVKTDGEAKAKTYSAEPGHSEHETGLAIDVSGSDGKCEAEDCFADTKEAKWLAQHASEYGFIIRYPKGKDAITGYQYEPWHIRYVGLKLAKEIADKGLTLEEYYHAVPVSKP